MKRKDKNKTPDAPPPVDPQRYAAWIAYLFDRPTEGQAWFWDLEVKDFEASPAELVALVGQTCLRSGNDLAAFTDTQISNGLNYMFNNAASSVVFAFLDEQVPESQRVQSVLAIKHLYRDCFAKRCASVLSHLDEPGGGDLNLTCYMFWDLSPLGAWKDVVLDVMEDTLTIPNIACAESALHGLGHRQSHNREQVESIIDRFLASTDKMRLELERYARAARGGCIQ